MKNQKTLSVLIVEDMENDAQLLVHALKKDGYTPVYERVETADQMRAALARQPWDVIISDYSLPQFSGEGALAILMETGLDIPFIVVSGTMGEETAVSMMRAGTQDYLMKGNLTRLIPAVERELEQAEMRRERRKNQEQLLLQSSALNAAANAILITDREGNIESANPAFTALTGYPLEEAIGKNPRDLLKSGVHDQAFYRDLWETILSGRVWHGELINRRKDGSLYVEEGTITPLRNDDGAVSHFIVIKQDITARKQAEQALAASEAELRALVEQVPAIVYTESAETRETTYISKQLEKLTGYTADEWMRDHNFWKKIIHPEDLETVVGVDRHTSATREPFLTEYRVVTRDGRVIWIRDEAVLIQSQDGIPLFWQGVMYDITERKHAEEDIRQRVSQLEMLYESGLALSQLLNPKEIGEKIIELLREKLGWHHTSICLYNTQDDSLKLLDFNQPGLKDEADKRAVEERFNRIIANSGNGLTGWALSTSSVVRRNDVTSDPHYIETYPGIRSGLYVPMKMGSHRIGVIGVESEQPNAFSEADERLIVTLANQAAGALENARLFEETRQRVAELEMLYQSGLTLSQLLTPNEIGEKVLELLEQKLNWRHTRIRLYHPEDESLELLDFNRPGLQNSEARRNMREQFRTLITHAGQGVSGWVIQHGESVRSGDVTKVPRYVEAYPGIRSGLYVPMKLGERVIGVISIEDERRDAFSEADERLIATLANQAASAFENARLFKETRRRVMELETLNRISLILRAVSKQNEMLAIVLDEALAILDTSHGSIELYNRNTNEFDKVITRGWLAQVPEPPQGIHEGISGRVFASGEIHISREFASDPVTREVSRGYVPPGWGGACLPIRTSQQTLGVMLVSVPGERELNKDEIRLLSILSEMTGAALQRMQLHEQTVRRLDQLNALRAVDQAISSSRDMQLTLNILLTHTITQLNVDAADVLLLHAGTNMLELVAGRGFHTLLFENFSLSASLAGRVIMEHRSSMTLDFEAVRQNPQLGKLWKAEGFLGYWCVPLVVKGEIKGVLEVYCRREFTPDMEWVEFLEAFAGQAAIAIDNTQLFGDLQRANMDLSLAYDATIEGWSRALDLRDHETEGHTLRVTELTLKLARAMRVSESQLIAIRRGALLHDIGKMGVPDSILLKEGELTDEEWVVMRQHPQFARDMLLPIAYLKDALDIPYCHHEKWDGTGYPQGLKGDHIPIAARIFAVVDVWDALTNDRTYRKKWTKQKARKYLRDESGKHFDPQIVEIFLKYIENG
ncbi:MAG: GAF domain-containing protein [Chloroflexi bacterium]|nr:GAF domain-containing protein [Chloroflexota bacterium]